MKKLLLTLVIALSFMGTTPVAAQSCAVISNDAVYNACCSTYTAENTERCSAYYDAQQNGNATSACRDIRDESTYKLCCVDYSVSENAVACKTYKDNGGRTPAEAQAYCGAIQKVNNAKDYNECCKSTNGVAYNADRCYDWFITSIGGTPDTGGSGQIGGGIQPTQPITKQPLISGNPDVYPQSSSPVLAECSAIRFKSLLDILVWIKCVITSIIIPLIFTLAIFFFLWNVFVFIRSSEKTNKEEAKQRMVWGLVALFVMLGVWGIIAIVSGTFGITPSVPLLQTEYLDPAKANK